MKRNLRLLSAALAVVYILFLAVNDLRAQTCCANEVYPNNGFETAGTLNSKFPNSTLSPTNNAVSMANSTTCNCTQQLGGWFLGTSQNTVGPGYVITDATRASEGSRFWYINPAITNTGNANSLCIQNSTVLTSNLTCNTNNIIPGRRYVACADFAAFLQSSPSGSVKVSQPVFEYATVTPVVAFDRLTFYDATGTTIPSLAAVDWNNVKTSWKRGWVVFTGKVGYEYVAYSILETATAGALFDNTSLQELQIASAPVTNTTCNPANNARVFQLNPVSNSGGVPNLLYTVTAPAGYTVTPSTGVYGTTTTFTLTKNVGSAIGTGPLTITVADQVNTECQVPTIVPDVVQPSGIVFQLTQATCAGPTGQNNGSLAVTAVVDADKYGYSTGASYGGTDYASSPALGSLPFTVVSGVPNAGQTYTVRFFNGSNTCFRDTTVVFGAVTCACTLAVDSASTNVTAPNGSDGTATVTPSGGTPGYTYLWSNGGTTATISGLPAGSYRVTVTDAFGCTAACSVTVSAPSCPTIVLGPSPLPDGEVGAPYSAQITAAGGSGPYLFGLFPSGTSSVPPGLSIDPNTGIVSGTPTSTGAFSVKITVVDDNLCPDTLDPVAITIACPPTAPYEICPGQSYELDAGPGLINIQWFKDGQPIPGANSQLYVATSVGSYHFTATMTPSGCSAEGCCPAVIVAGNCPVCPPKVCMPVKIRKN